MDSQHFYPPSSDENDATEYPPEWRPIPVKSQEHSQRKQEIERCQSPEKTGRQFGTEACDPHKVKDHKENDDTDQKNALLIHRGYGRHYPATGKLKQYLSNSQIHMLFEALA
jgi:hypothetical protein